jgi:hypothetical protein
MQYDYEIQVRYNKETKKFFLGISPDWTELKFLTGELIDILYHKPYIDFIFEYIVNDLKYTIKLVTMFNQSWTYELLYLAPNIKNKEVILFLQRQNKPMPHNSLYIFRALSDRKFIQRYDFKTKDINKMIAIFYNI